jgi:ATP-dependent Clp protease ATP-binding subunit ClpB
LIQTTIEDRLAQEVLSGRVLEGDTVVFDVDESSDGLRIVHPAEVAEVAVGAAS